MKASIEWLEEYSDIDVTPERLGDILTMTGSKVETIDQKGNDIKNVVVGKILKIEKHPNADKLVVTEVDVGSEKIQIVTGAKNINVGDIVPIAKDGAELPNGVKIKKGDLRGIDSCGMMCSVGELNLDIADYPEQIEDGIMILDKNLEKDLGKNIVDVLNLKEDIIDFEITSNRPDCFSIEGLGRETAVSLHKDFKNPRGNLDKLNIEDKKEIEGLKVDIKAPDLCYRYIARVVKDVKVGESPEWMKRRLRACGMRSINNIVDITNYVMLELGQPMHAFDERVVKNIRVKLAKDKDTYTTLDGIERTLSKDTLMITNGDKYFGIAGVMGGLDSEILPDTTSVFIESANFDAGSIRKSAVALGLRTEASARYEKSLDPNMCDVALKRLAYLLKNENPDMVIASNLTDVYPEPLEEKTVILKKDKLKAYTAIDFSDNEVVKSLESLDFKVKVLEDAYEVIVPTFRATKDVSMDADIIEEIVRLYGYENIKEIPLKLELTGKEEIDNSTILSFPYLAR